MNRLFFQMIDNFDNGICEWCGSELVIIDRRNWNRIIKLCTTCKTEVTNIRRTTLEWRNIEDE